MVRTQVQFPADQLEILREMAARQGVSVSNLVRHAVASAARAEPRPRRSELRQRALDVAGSFRSEKPDTARTHDESFGGERGP
jgi:hypothetical protein